MANPIKKDELVTQEAINQVNDLIESMNKLVASLAAFRGATAQQAQETAKNATATQESVEAYARVSAQIASLEKLLTEERKVTTKLTEDIKKLKEEKIKYGRATEEEKIRIKAAAATYKELADLVRQNKSATSDMLPTINAAKMSYNELAGTFNAVQAALRGMTKEEREGTEAGKMMVEQAKTMRDTMNQLQQAVGNYSLNVGNYASAFNGLRFQTQQVLREIPSAQNLQQFFLAISNNIPMFVDAVTRYNMELPKMKVQLTGITAEIAKQEALMAGMNTQTAEYAAKQEYVNTLKKQEIELQGLSQGGLKAILKSVVSWQTLLLAGLLLLRKLPDLISKIAGKTKEWFNALNEVHKEHEKIMTSVEGTMTKFSSELELIIDDLKNTTRGTNEWKNAIARVNEITKSNLNDTTATIGEVEKVTKAYLEQQKQLEINKKVAEAYAKQQLKEYALENMFMPGSDWETLLDWTGMSDDKIKQLKELFSKQQKKIDKAIATGADYIPSLYDALLGDGKRVGHDNALNIWNTYSKNVSASGQRLRQMYNDLYKSMPAASSSGSGREKEERYNYEEVPDRWWDAEKALIRKMKEGYDEEIALQQLAHEKAKSELVDWLTDRENALYSNLMTDAMKMANGDKNKAYEIYNAIISKDEQTVATMSEDVQSMYSSFWYNIEEGQRQHDLIMQGLIIDNNEAIKAINQKYDKEQMDAIQERYKAKMKVVSRRSRTIVQEQQKNADLAYNINVLRQEMKALTTAQYKDNDSKKEAAQRAAALSKEIDKLRKQMQFEKQLSNYGSIWDIFQRNGAFEASNGTMRGIAKNLLGDLADSLDDEQIEQVYDTWLQNTQKAATEWYNTTMGYINDLIGAYVELANAKAEAAAEATEAAQEEYEKEKALLEAGYASRVEATWAEYQEKKAAQEKAEADAKAAAQAQQQLNEVETMGSLIVASANIWKTFSKIPTVGIPLAIAALTTMWGSFAAAKIKAAEVSKYGEGGFEVLEGGSHASGHDIDLGVRNRRGRRMRAEGKEGLGIFSRRAMDHYGANNIEAMVNSVNRLEFEGNSAKRMSLERNIGLQMLSMPRTDLHRLESGMDKLVSYGAKSVHHNPDGTVVETRKNARITYHIMR